jgi:hypothetical protein
VPVTSYYWHLAFGGVLAVLTTGIGSHVRTTRQLVLTSFPAALLTIVLGVVAFLPFHGLAALGVPHGVAAASALAIAAVILIASRKRVTDAVDPFLLALVAIFYVFHAAVAVVSLPPAHLAFVTGAVIFAIAINVIAHASPWLRSRRAVSG